MLQEENCGLRQSLKRIQDELMAVLSESVKTMHSFNQTNTEPVGTHLFYRLPNLHFLIVLKFGCAVDSMNSPIFEMPVELVGDGIEEGLRLRMRRMLVTIQAMASNIQGTSRVRDEIGVLQTELGTIVWVSLFSNPNAYLALLLHLYFATSEKSRRLLAEQEMQLIQAKSTQSSSGGGAVSGTPWRGIQTPGVVCNDTTMETSQFDLREEQRQLSESRRSLSSQQKVTCFVLDIVTFLCQ